MPSRTDGDPTLPRYRVPLAARHKDGSQCPPSHKHTTSGKPLHPDCPGRHRFEAVCGCGAWKLSGPIKSYIEAERKRHLATHRTTEPTPGPAVLSKHLGLDAS